MIAFDIETKDPNLQEIGSGSIRKDGRILTVGIYDGTNAFALSLDHPEATDAAANFQKLQNIMASDETKIGHNVIYDADWIQNGYGVHINGTIDDTMTREGLINEYETSYKLDRCCKRHELEGKNYDDTVQQWWRDTGHKGKAIQHLDEVPLDLVNTYCLQDTISTYDLAMKQQPIMDRYDLNKINDLECRLIQPMLEFKKNGIRIDEAKRDEYINSIMGQLQQNLTQLAEEYGLENIDSPNQKRDAFHRLGIHSSLLTPSGAESFSAAALDEIEHPLARLLIETSGMNATLTKFLLNSLNKTVVNGRIHTTFYPTLRDEGGTITGRFSSRDPNLQNITKRKRKAKYGDLRALFLPEEGCLLGAFDYKQIEYRLFAHYAVGPGSEEVKKKMREGADYHDLSVAMLGWTGPEARDIAKSFNFGILYGLGKGGMLTKMKWRFVEEAHHHNMSLEEYIATNYHTTFEQYADNIRNEYYRFMPFVKPSVEAIKAVGKQRGYVKSMGGRLHRMPPDGGIYKLVNYLIQGSAADIMKMGIADAYEAGIFNVLKMHLTVHDELVFSIPQTKEGYEACIELVDILEHPLKGELPLKVPMKIDTEVGPNWSDCNGAHWKEFEGRFK